MKRLDALTQLAGQLALALFWFDPLVWVANRRMQLEREHACDDYVLRRADSM
ncbi:MAG: M56 family metallopeptidase [Gemmatimonadaceae bacterium]